ncbi:facilitated trehalose transporter Tret1-like [Bombus huntii]|uniref:facilitated trehalose transporter Tret1-like n=1 Tax=Bombus huntii TaxID=85661 RepID=UPI0021A9B615|nr:facilitated trehalose transporter Tret1-like [Bombus huntii]
MLGLIMAQQLSGNFITMQYLHVLLSKTTIGLDTHEATMLVLGADSISSSISPLQVESKGRRELLILSTLGSCSTLIILAIYLLLDQHEFDVSNFSILPVIDLIIYQVMFHIGLGTLPNVLLRELFPAELKGSVRAIIIIFDGIIGFTVPKLYQVITDNAGSCGIYFIFAASCSVAFVIVFIWVPETKGKTYHEIKALLVGENLNSPNEEVSTAGMDSREI